MGETEDFAAVYRWARAGGTPPSPAIILALLEKKEALHRRAQRAEVVVAAARHCVGWGVLLDDSERGRDFAALRETLIRFDTDRGGVGGDCDQSG